MWTHRLSIALVISIAVNIVLAGKSLSSLFIVLFVLFCILFISLIASFSDTQG